MSKRLLPTSRIISGPDVSSAWTLLAIPVSFHPSEVRGEALPAVYHLRLMAVLATRNMRPNHSGRSLPTAEIVVKPPCPADFFSEFS